MSNQHDRNGKYFDLLFIRHQAVVKLFHGWHRNGSPVTWGGGDAAQQHEQDEKKQWHPQAIHGGGGLTWIRMANH